MSRANRGLIAVMMLTAGATAAQPDATTHAPSPKAAAQAADATVEEYLERLQLKPLLAESLAARLADASADERGRLAERLGTLYVELISSTSGDERRGWESRAQELVRRVPEAETYQLRLDLARTVYAQAEAAAERWQLRLVEDDAKVQAIKDLEGVKAQFAKLAADLTRRVDLIERGTAGGRDQDLAEARRLRAVACYYDGWTGTYLAMLKGEPIAATEALKSFGWILGRAGNLPASPEKAPKGQLRFEDVARAAIGASLASSVAGNDRDAVRWLDMLEQTEGLPAAVRTQLPARRIAVLARAHRWDDLEAGLTALRRPTSEGAAPGLDALTARLLAVVAFESGLTGGATAQRLGQAAFQDLMAAGQLPHVLDLSTRYGTAPLGETGFIAHYVRGAVAFRRAQAEHKAAGDDPERPTTNAAAMNHYREAAGLLEQAARQPDTGRYAADAAKAMVLRGRALFYAGDLESAAEAFVKASADAQAAGNAADAQEGLWLGIIALDTAVRTSPEGRASSLVERLDELSTLFLRLYPSTQRAATLLINQRGGSAVQDEEAVKTLLNVAKDAPIYSDARRQAARILYRLYRGAAPADKDFAAGRFIAIAEEVLAAERRMAAAAADQPAKDAAVRAITVSRQLLDVLLGGQAPDAQRAASVLELMSQTAALSGADLSSVQDELDYRRFQIHLAKGEMDAAQVIATRLGREGAPPAAARFALSAQRTMYLRAVAVLAAEQGSGKPDEAAIITAARRVMEQGRAVLGQFAPGEAGLRDAAAASVAGEVAKAASLLGAAGDRAALELAINLDRDLLKARPGQIECLRRLGTNAEAAADRATALECWRVLSSGLDPSQPDWFAARYNFLRLLADQDAAGARLALEQHVVLYPAYGPEPWGTKLRALHAKLGAVPAPASGAAGRPATGGAP